MAAAGVAIRKRDKIVSDLSGAETGDKGNCPADRVADEKKRREMKVYEGGGTKGNGGYCVATLKLWS